ncbi:hypothetical protein BH10PSE1_BH10PSE1_03240 [soil metagenome]
MGFCAHLRKRWKSPHLRQSAAIATVAMLPGGLLGAAIQTHFHLYSTSFTMSMVGLAAFVIGVLILWPLDRRWYGWAWAAALILPTLTYFAFMRVLEAHPPTPPLG